MILFIQCNACADVIVEIKVFVDKEYVHHYHVYVRTSYIRAWMFEGFETSLTRGRKPIGIDTATTQAEPTENGALKRSLWGHSFI